MDKSAFSMFKDSETHSHKPLTLLPILAPDRKRGVGCGVWGMGKEKNHTHAWYKPRHLCMGFPTPHTLPPTPFSFLI